ncbi:hypothetical protein EV696_108166, partial [Permianibacter aggregans]
AHVSEFPLWTPVIVKLLLPPRQSRGNSRYGLGNDQELQRVSKILPVVWTTNYKRITTSATSNKTKQISD